MPYLYIYLYFIYVYVAGDDYQCNRQVKEAENEAVLVTQAVAAAKGMMARADSAWETYDKLHSSFQTWLMRTAQLQNQCSVLEAQVTSVYLY